MSTSIIVDTFDETTVSRDEHGWYATRTAKMLSLTGNPSAIVYNALIDPLITSNNLAYGQVHPTMTALYCASCTGKAIDRDKVLVTSQYRPFVALYVASATQVALFSIGASIQSTQTNLDRTGSVMTVQPSTASVSQTAQSGLVNADVAILAFSFKRKEPAPASAMALSYVNCLNQFPFTVSGISFSARTVKLERIQCDPADNGTTNDYICTYEFTYRPLLSSGTYSGTSAWDAVIVFQDTGNGNVPPSDAADTHGLAQYKIYNDADFSSLFLW